MLDRLDAHFAAPLRALNMRTMRSEVLATNIANADTPHFKARDLDFSQALRKADSGGFAMARTAERHLTGHSTPALMSALQYRIPVQASIDGNTVEVDNELAQFSNNAIYMQADLNFLNGRIRSMQTALQSQ